MVAHAEEAEDAQVQVAEGKLLCQGSARVPGGQFGFAVGREGLARRVFGDDAQLCAVFCLRTRIDEQPASHLYGGLHGRQCAMDVRLLHRLDVAAVVSRSCPCEMDKHVGPPDFSWKAAIGIHIGLDHLQLLMIAEHRNRFRATAYDRNHPISLSQQVSDEPGAYETCCACDDVGFHANDVNSSICSRHRW